MLNRVASAVILFPMTSYTTDTPIYALSTPFAPSALAVVRCSGDNTIEMLSKAFSSPSKLLAAKTNTLVHGYLLDGEGKRIDEVQLCVYHKGHGYTAEEAVEIMAHGSLAGLKRIFICLEELGFRPAERGEFTFRAFMHGRMDLTQAEAVEEIVSAKGVTAQAAALSRLEGSLKKVLMDIKGEILDILSSLEVQLDYAEDEILEDWVFPSGQVAEIKARLNAIIGTYSTSKLYAEGAKVVLAGSANAGKSSLFNLLVKENRAIVSAIPGTTRDYIETWIQIGGIPVRLFDTAGLRSGSDEIEEEGIRRSRSLMEEADLIVYLVDSSSPVPPEEFSSHMIVVYSKSDVSPLPGRLQISSVTGEGVEALTSAIASFLSKGKQGMGSDVSIESERQCRLLKKTVEDLEYAEAHSEVPVDLMALCFQDCLADLGEVTGEVTTEDVLDNLFSRFCVGK
jgi:tRNA modification GTPase TrmE